MTIYRTFTTKLFRKKKLLEYLTADKLRNSFSNCSEKKFFFKFLEKGELDKKILKKPIKINVHSTLDKITV
jgi:hypothetical protein